MLLEVVSDSHPFSFQSYISEILLETEIEENKIYSLGVAITKEIKTFYSLHNYPPFKLESGIASFLDYLDENKERRDFSNVAYIAIEITTSDYGYSFEIITKLERI